MIYLSAAAAGEIKRLQSKHPDINMLLRLRVQQSGCSGLAYQMEFAQQVLQDDQIYRSGGLEVIIDPLTFQHVNGLSLDYSEDLMGGAFRFDNPNATQICSCGNSFAVSPSQA